MKSDPYDFGMDQWWESYQWTGSSWPAIAEYAARASDRTVAPLAERCGSLLIVGCGDMPESHVRIAAGFDRVTCMDIVTACLGNAERKLGTAASYRCESIVTTGLPDNLFDAAFCAHVIYHIDKNEQETAVRQLIRVTRPGGRLVIIYSNPRSPLAVPGAVMRMVRRKVNAWRGLPGFHPYHYYSPLPLSWWRRFAVECDVTFFPGAVFGRRQTRALVWSNRTAAALFKAAAWFETKAPHAAVRLWQFPIVVLDKKARTPGEAVVR